MSNRVDRAATRVYYGVVERTWNYEVDALLADATALMTTAVFFGTADNVKESVKLMADTVAVGSAGAAR